MARLNLWSANIWMPDPAKGSGKIHIFFRTYNKKIFKKKEELTLKTLYYYMPPCPKCKSERTGRYLAQPYVNKHYTVIESLKNGELVQLKKTVPRNNAYCADCGFEWHEEPRLVRIEQEEKEDEIARRGTEKLLYEYYEKNHIDPDKKGILGGVFSGFTKFF